MDTESANLFDNKFPNNQLRHSSVLHRTLTAPTLAYMGAGADLLYSPDNWVTDLSSGAGMFCLGYDCQAVLQALYYQAERLCHAHAQNWTTDVCELLAQKLLQLDPAFAGGAVMFLNGGGEAMEAACKLAIQYFKESGYQQKPQFVAKTHSYHGNSIFCLGLGDHPRKYPYNSYLPRRPHRFVDNAGYAQLLSHGQERPWVTVMEPIGGTTIGIEEPPDLPVLHSLATHGPDQLLIYDEILCGNYRTGFPFAYQYYNSPAPDMCVIGKGLTGGYFPLSAVIVNGKIANAIKNGSGKLWHSTTNQNHPLGCAMGLAALEQYQQIDFAPLLAQYQQLIANLRTLVPISGAGTLWGVHLRKDAPGLHLQARTIAREYGLCLYTEGQTVAGQGNFLLLAPAYCLQGEALNSAFERLADLVSDPRLQF